MATSSLPPNPAILTGNDALIKINGLAVGFMKSLRVSISANVERILTLGRRKPKGLKSLSWQGTASGEFHILRTPAQGVVTIDTYNDEHADDLYEILIIDKKTGNRVGQLIGAVNTDGFDLQNNEFSNREVEFELMDFEPMEAYN